MLVLVVDPDRLLCDTLAVTLQALGDIDSVIARDVVEAEALIVSCRPDVIMATGWLPGRELVRLMKDARAFEPDALQVALEVPHSVQADLAASGVDLLLPEGEPPGRLLKELARLLPAVRTGRAPAAFFMGANLA